MSNISSHFSEGFRARLARVHASAAAEIRLSAHELHAAVNQFYCKSLPYGVHLDMVAENIMTYGDRVLRSDDDLLPVYFGAYYHDSIEDARLTYNDVIRVASRHMTHGQAVKAAEIVYALTNDKGRTRSERAGERYYSGIRSTPYAPIVKLSDRLANMTFSASGLDPDSDRMLRIYSGELPHFLAAIDAGPDAPVEFSLPADMVAEVLKLAKV